MCSHPSSYIKVLAPFSSLKNGLDFLASFGRKRESCKLAIHTFHLLQASRTPHVQDSLTHVRVGLNVSIGDHKPEELALSNGKKKNIFHDSSAHHASLPSQKAL